MVEGDKLASTPSGVSVFKEEILGGHLWARGYLAVSPGNLTDEMIKEYIDEQEGEQIEDESRFQIDNP